mgnify:CR=1 FL=1
MVNLFAFSIDPWSKIRADLRIFDFGFTPFEIRMVV